ncbi:MAG: UDP-N-acetylmuramate dehydrogenase [bacterium]
MTIKDLQQNVDLINHTTLKSKAIAQYFYVTKTKQEIIDLYNLALKEKIKFILLGGGSNVALVSNYIKGIVVKNLYIEKTKLLEDSSKVIYKVSSGYPTAKLVSETIDEGLEGLEYHKGLPGNVGGAIYMNSKWTNPVVYFGDYLVEAEILTKDGKEKKVDKGYFQFAYDFSILHETREILLDITFEFKKVDKKVLIKRSEEAFAYRKKTQPFGVFTSGCFFRNISNKEKQEKNLPSNSAGYLIDKTGLKGKKMGGFKVSDNHANFIINNGTGKPEDLKKLLNLIKTNVKRKFGIDLKEEVVLVN